VTTLPFVVGDLQGCCTEFESLLKAIRFYEHQRPIWCVGDLVNRGPRSPETLRLLMSLGSRAQCVLGNHDLHCLAVAAGARKASKRDTARAILDAPDAFELLEFLRHCPLAYQDQSIVMVHAGLYPFWSSSQLMQYTREVNNSLRSVNWQTYLETLFGNEPSTWSEHLEGSDRHRFIINACTRMRFVYSDGRLDLVTKESEAPSFIQSGSSDGARPWFDFPQIQDQTQHTIVFGHWSTRGLVQRPRLYGLDTGCVWGGSLTAIDLESFELTQIKCEKHQCP
jgi:bis(5'-nucleosyl)-tetraphosphatase (symmetrical)